MQTVYYTTMHLEALQASSLLDTNEYLLILVAILDLASRWHPNMILTPETDSSPYNYTVHHPARVTVVNLAKMAETIAPLRHVFPVFMC